MFDSIIKYLNMNSLTNKIDDYREVCKKSQIDNFFHQRN